MEPAPLDLETLLRHDILTFQRGSQPHASLVGALRAASVDGKHVHAVSSISALALLAESGFGLATLPRPVAEQLERSGRIRILETALPLVPLPLYASYWNDATDPAPRQAIREAVAAARAHGAEYSRQASAVRFPPGAPEFSAPGTKGSDALLAGSSASPGAS